MLTWARSTRGCLAFAHLQLSVLLTTSAPLLVAPFYSETPSTDRARDWERLLINLPGSSSHSDNLLQLQIGPLAPALQYFYMETHTGCRTKQKACIHRCKGVLSNFELSQDIAIRNSAESIAALASCLLPAPC